MACVRRAGSGTPKGSPSLPRSPMTSWTWRLTALCLALAAAACTTPRLDVPRPRSEAWPHPSDTALGRAFGDQLGRRGGQSGFHLLVSGMEAFSIRAALAE